MKKVLIISSEFPPLPGGIGNHAYNLANYLQKNDYEISVVTDYRSKINDDVFDKQLDFDVIRIKRNYFTYFNRINQSFTASKNKNTLIASGKFSLWVVGFISIFFTKKHYLAVVHGSELQAGNFISRALTKWSLKRFDNLIAVSNFTKNFALQINPKLCIDVINNGIEIGDNYITTKTIDNSINLVTVGNVTYRKGQQNGIAALPILKEKFQNVHYHCIGIPTEIQKFSDLAISLKVQEMITFHGVLDQNQMNNIVDKSQIFMMLSDIVKNDFEGFGIAILEANLNGLPAIGSINSGISDAISNRISGVLVNPHDVNEIFDAISDIVNNYEKYTVNAQEWAKQFDWNIIIKKYIAILEK